MAANNEQSSANKITCVRAGIEMTKAEWFSIPLAMRQQYWQETDHGNKSDAVSPQLAASIRRLLGR